MPGDVRPSDAFEKLCAVVVDDDPGDQLLTRHVLLQSNAFSAIHTANSADEGLALLSKHHDSLSRSSDARPSAIVFLDIWMPRMTGLEFLEAYARIRAQDERATSVIAMLSSSSDVKDRSLVEEYDFVIDYLTKPLQLADVERICRAIDAFVGKDEA